MSRAMPKFAVILAAAGKSSRFGDAHRKKPFVELKGRPVWVRAVEPFINHPDVAQTIVVVSPEDMEWFREKFRPNLAFMNIDLVDGGKERADSVANGLAAVREEIDFVAVHDAARPLITRQLVDSVFTAAVRHRAVIPAIPISSTIKRVDQGTIRETVPREGLRQAQTPQVFARDLLVKAFAQSNRSTATDEAQLVEWLGQRVAIVEGTPTNLKITTQDDFRMAQALVELVAKANESSILHPFAVDNPHWFS